MSVSWAGYLRRRRRSRGAAAFLAVVTAAVVGLLGWFFLRGQFELGDGSAGPSTARVYDWGWMKPIPVLHAVPDASARSVLDALPVAAKESSRGYERMQFGQAWADADRNGCDTRNDILRRDLSAVTFTASSARTLCRVASGELWDPYTGRHIPFERGQGSSQTVQIDHVVALAEAWKSGADHLSSQERQTLANDPLNLLAVDGATNQSKSAQDASTWLPDNKAFRCHYVARQVSVKYSYGLSVSAQERDAMRRVLDGCPEQNIIGRPGVPGR